MCVCEHISVWCVYMRECVNIYIYIVSVYMCAFMYI